MQATLLGMIVSPLIGFGLGKVWPIEPTAGIEWAGDNYGTVNFYPDRCDPAPLSGRRATVAPMPDNPPSDGPPADWGLYVRLHDGQAMKFVVTEEDARELARRLTMPRREVRMFSEGPDGAPTTHVIRSADVESVDVQHEPDG